MRFVTCICVAMVLSLSGCGEDSTGPDPRPPAPGKSAFDRQVRENCEAVAAAADAYYQDNGDYSWWSIAELVTYLPDGRRLVNPATGEATEPGSPIDDDILLDPWAPGSIGIRVFPYIDVANDYQWVDLGYYIVGKGENCDIVLTNVPGRELLLDRERQVLENCRIVAAAAEAFARDNGGVYARDNRRDTSDLGLTIQDYLPDGLTLMNPYQELRTEPQWGAAPVQRGQVGYIALDADGNGLADGYVVEGVGAIEYDPFCVLVQPPEPGRVQPPDVPVDPCLLSTSQP